MIKIDSNPESVGKLKVGTSAATPAAGELTVGSNIIAGSGAVGTPAFTFNGDTDTGLYRTAANSLGVATAGTARIVVAADGAVTLNNFTLPTAIGSSGQVLKVPSSGSVLEWGDEGGGGGGGGGITGSGTQYYIPVFTSGSAIGDSIIQVNSGGTHFGVGGTPVQKWTVKGGAILAQDAVGKVQIEGTVNGTVHQLQSDQGEFKIRDNNRGNDMYSAKGVSGVSQSYHRWMINDSERMELTYEGVLELNGANTNSDGDAYSKIENTKSLTLANGAATSFSGAGAMFAIYDTSSTVGGLFFSHFSASSVEKIAGSTHFSVSSSSGSIRITTAANDATVTVTNEVGNSTTIKILVLSSGGH